MQQKGKAIALCLVATLGACAEPLTAPASAPELRDVEIQQAQREGTGLVLEDDAWVELPLIGRLGEVNIDQAVITRLIIDEVAGNIVGLEAEGVLTLSGGALGTEIVQQEFLTQVHVVSNGPGKCSVLTVDLGEVGIDALGDAVFVDVPEAAVNARSVGAVGSLLCNLGRVLQRPVDAATGAVRGLVNAINRVIL